MRHFFLKMRLIFYIAMASRWPGVDVTITTVWNFTQFSAEKNGVFLKNQCYDQNF
jgi:hypothetical protein